MRIIIVTPGDMRAMSRWASRLTGRRLVIFRVGLGISVVLLLGFLLLLFTEPPSSILPSSTPNPGVTEQLPQRLSGTGDQKTATFGLSGGEYLVDWTARAVGSCAHRVALREAAGLGSFNVTDTDFATTSAGGTVPIQSVAPGYWYFDVVSGCTWTLTIHRP